MSDIVPINPKLNLKAGAAPTGIVPSNLDEAYRLAQAVSLSSMAPKDFDTPEKIMVAIMTGLEIGLKPMQALQRIAVINGRPTLWGDAAMGLVRSSGLCEWVKELVEGDGDGRAAICETKRKDDPNPIIGRFSVADAKRANLWDERNKVERWKKDRSGKYEADNDSPWHRFPDRMLQMRARGFCFRDAYADVLGGMYLREELEEEPRDVTPSLPVPPVPPAPPPPIDWLKLKLELSAADSRDAIQAVYDGFVAMYHPAGSVLEEALSLVREASNALETAE